MHWQVTDASPGVVQLLDPAKDWRSRKRPYAMIKKGDFLTAQSGARAVITEVTHTHPREDVTMYVDAITITTQRPEQCDKQGNPCLGLLESVSDQGQTQQ